MVVFGLGLWIWGFGLGRGRGVASYWGMWPSGVFNAGALYINIEE